VQHDPPDPNDPYHRSLERLTILTDGVFAIAMTLLAIELALPESAQHLSRYDLLRALLATWPHVFAYVQSFSILALFWLVNYRLDRVLRRVDQPYLLLHLLFLLFIAFQPYPTSVFGAHLFDPVAFLFYTSVQMLTSGIRWAMWWYATRHALLNPELSAEQIGYFHRLLAAPPIMFLLLSVVNLWDLVFGAGRGPVIVATGLGYLFAALYLIKNVRES
jgi:uncharacterized membrane protein